MKKTIVFGLLAFMLVFVLIGCDNDTTNESGKDIVNPFKGTWESDTVVPLPCGNGIITFVIGDTTWGYTSTVNFAEKGTYIFTVNNGTMTVTHQSSNNGSTWSNDLSGLPKTSFPCSVSGNSFIVNNYQFTKQ